MLLTLRACHPPATVAAFVASLDLLGALRDLLAVAAGVVFVTASIRVITGSSGCLTGHCQKDR